MVRVGEKYYIYIQEPNHAATAKTKESKNKGEEVTKEAQNEIHFQAIEVVPGTTDLGYTEIKLVETIPADAKIVIKGAFYLLATSKGGGEHED